jgi:hypothetical protein
MLTRNAAKVASAEQDVNKCQSERGCAQCASESKNLVFRRRTSARCFDYACRFASESAGFAQHDIKKVAGKSKAADRNDLRPSLMTYPRSIRVNPRKRISPCLCGGF